MTCFWNRKKKLLSGAIGVFVVGAVLFAGCSDSTAKEKENSVAGGIAV